MDVNCRVFIISRELLLHIYTQLTYENDILNIRQFQFVHIPIDIDVFVALDIFQRLHHICRQFGFVSVLNTLDTFVKMINDIILVNRQTLFHFGISYAPTNIFHAGRGREFGTDYTDTHFVGAECAPDTFVHLSQCYLVIDLVIYIGARNRAFVRKQNR